MIAILNLRGIYLRVTVTTTTAIVKFNSIITRHTGITTHTVIV